MTKNISIHTLHKLVVWFHQVREDYFFREERSPYRVWVSEVALQQTRIQAALAPLQRFFTHFPNVEDLAAASEEEAVFAFRGLGYYSRARNLRKGAIFIMENYAGKLPTTYNELLKVPSIGPYTAAAISSICFGAAQPVCDGNVKRVLLRMNKWKLTARDPLAEKKCLQQLQNLYKNLISSAGDTNEALMELGQKICTRTQPKCEKCPVRDSCRAFQTNSADKYPVKTNKEQKVDVNWYLFVIKKDGQILLQKWMNFYFLKKHVSFPSILEFPQQKICSWNTDKTPKQIIRKYSATPLAKVKHSITKHRISIYPYSINVKSWQENMESNPLFWVDEKQVNDYLVSSALSKVWKNYSGEIFV